MRVPSSDKSHPLTRHAARKMTKAAVKANRAVERCPRPYHAVGAVAPTTVKAKTMAIVLIRSRSSG